MVLRVGVWEADYSLGSFNSRQKLSVDQSLIRSKLAGGNRK